MCFRNVIYTWQTITKKLKNIVDNIKTQNFCEEFLAFPTNYGKPKEMIIDFLKFGKEYKNAINAKDEYFLSTADETVISNAY